MAATSAMLTIAPRPSGRPAMHMRWFNLLFLHWPIAPEKLRPLVPPALEIDIFDGQAWVGLIPFSMCEVRHMSMGGFPLSPWFPGIPTTRCFHECNVRTYVRPLVARASRPSVTRPAETAGPPDGEPASEPGVYFFSLDAASRLAAWAARQFWQLSYFPARMRSVRRGNVIEYEVDRCGPPLLNGDCRAALRCSWRVGAELPRAQPGELAHFLTERYSLYTVQRLRGTSAPQALLRGRIWHEPWPLRNAELLSLDDSLVRAAGIEIDRSQPPIVYHADDLSVDAWPLERVL